MSTPGAATEMYLPKVGAGEQLVRDVARCHIRDRAGKSGGDFDPALPAATISTMHAFAVGHLERARPGKLMLMMRAPWFTDQLMALEDIERRALGDGRAGGEGVPSAERAAGVVPSSRWCATVAPAIVAFSVTELARNVFGWIQIIS
jgi:hypothetical protein